MLFSVFSLFLVLRLFVFHCFSIEMLLVPFLHPTLVMVQFIAAAALCAKLLEIDDPLTVIIA